MVRSKVVGFLFALMTAVRAAQNGSICVGTALVEMFDLINDLRAKMTTSTIYSVLTAANTEYTTNSYLTLQDGTKIYLNYGQSAITDVIAELDAATAGVAPLLWKEGLAKASADFVSSWVNFDDDAIPATGALSTATRAALYGKPTTPTEYPLTRAPDIKMSGQDALLLLLIADGENAVNTFVSKLISADYKAIGADIQTDTVAPLPKPKVMLDVLIDTDYRNKQHTAPCQVYPFFGGGNCDPNVTEQAIFEAINLVRTDPGNTKITTAFTAIKATFNGYISTYDYYGTGSTINRNTKEGQAGVIAAETYLSGKAAAVTQLEPLDFSPGLYHACVDHAVDVVNENTVTDFGRDESSPQDRASRYGSFGNSPLSVKQYHFFGKDDALNIVLQMLIDDGDSGRQRRNEIFNPVNKSVALAWRNHTLYGKITVLMYGLQAYKTNEPFSYCAEKMLAKYSTGAASMMAVSATILTLLLFLAFD